MDIQAELAQARAEDMADGLTEPGQAQPEGAEPAPEMQAAPDYHREASGAVEMVAALVTGFAPKAADIWTPQTKGAVSAALVPVMEKYGFSFGAMPPEFMLLIVAGPPIYQTARLVAETIDEKRAEAAKAKAKEAADKANVETGPIVTRPTGQESPEVMRHAQMGLYQ